MIGSAVCNTDWEPVSTMRFVLLDFEVSHCTFKNYDTGQGAGAVLSMDRCFNLQVHDCAFSDIGVSKLVIGHNMVIGGSGYFKVYNNTFTRQWANSVRMFPVKLNALGYDGKDAVTRYYNNISWEKRKYPDFEQNTVRPNDLAKSKYLSRTGSEIYFNTLYRSRKGTMTADPYVAPLVDTYAPDVVIKYNLIIDPECDVPFDPARNYVYQLGTGPQPGIVVEGNLVYKSLEDAGFIDAVNFVPSKTSPVKDVITGRVDYITKDHYGNERYVGAGADAGAGHRDVGGIADRPKRIEKLRTDHGPQGHCVRALRRERCDHLHAAVRCLRCAAPGRRELADRIWVSDQLANRQHWREDAVHFGIESLRSRDCEVLERRCSSRDD